MKLSTQDCYDLFRHWYREKSQRYFDPTDWAPAAISEAIDAIDADIADINPEAAGLLSTNLSYESNVQEPTDNLPEGAQEVEIVEVTDRGGPPYPRLAPARFRDRSGLLVGPWSPDMYGGGRGEPAAYYVRGVDPVSDTAPVTYKMGFIPIPSRSAADNVLVWYRGVRRRVTALSATTYPDLPVILHMLIPRRMCVLAAIADGQKVEYYTGLYNSVAEPRITQLTRGLTEEASEQVDIVDEEFYA